MNTKKFIIGLLFLIVNLLDRGSDFDDYQKLEIQNVSSITREDLPSEFSDKAYETVDEFIRKTRDLDYEIVLYFDYVTGEVHKCAKGDGNNVKLNFEENEFKKCNIASIHNHPSSVYSPPSDKNFGILMRTFEDYELIASAKELWILKAKGVNPIICFDLKDFAEKILESC